MQNLQLNSAHLNSRQNFLHCQLKYKNHIIKLNRF